MNPERSLICLGLPVYNGQRYIRQAIESVLSQTYSNFRLVISDNCSTDATPAICRAYAHRDPRIIYHRNPANVGAVRNFDQVLEWATSEYFAWIAHDDVWAPDFLEACAAALDAHPDVVVAFAGVRVIDEEGRVLEDFNVPHRFDSPILRERVRDIVSLRHRAYAAYGLFRTKVLRTIPILQPYVDSDRVFLLRVALRGRILQIPPRLFYSRTHGERYSSLSPTPLLQVRWFDTSKTNVRTVFPSWRLWREYFRAVTLAPLSAPKKLSSHFQVALCPFRAQWFRRRLRFEVSRQVRQVLQIAH